MRIGIIGYYGFHNLGDELNLQCMMSQLREQFKSVEFLVNDKFNRDNAITPGTSTRDVLNSCNFLMIGGGGIINLGGFWFPFMDDSITVPYIIYRVGIDDGAVEPVVAEQYKKLFLGAKEVTVRDHYSLDLCRKYLTSQVEIVPEAIWNHPYKEVNRKEKTGNNIGINLRNYPPEVFPALRSFFNVLRKQEYQLNFIPCQVMEQNQNLNDNKYHRLVAGKEDYIMPDNSSIEERCRFLSGMDLCIGMRLHFVLLSLSYRIPVIALNYNNKVKGLMDEADLSDYIIDLNGNDLQGSLEKLFHQLIQEKDKIEIHLKNRVKIFEKEARRFVLPE